MTGIDNLQKPLVSIVVPVYNVEKYLCECIDSICNQSYLNLDIILIDDGSTDGGPAICDSYARRDKRITVVHQKNQGLSVARNTGLKFIKGEILAFVDSDDKVEEDFIKKAVGILEKRNLDVLIFETWLIDEESRVIGTRFHEYDEYTEVTKEKALEKIITDTIGSQVWKAIYKSKCWTDVLFPVGRLYEDIATTYKAYANVENAVGFIQDKLYCYRLNSNGISLSEKNQKKKIYHIFLGFLDQYQYAYSHCNGEVVIKCLKNVSESAGNVMMLFDYGSMEYRKAQKFLKESKCLILKCKFSTSKIYFKLLLCAIFPRAIEVIKWGRKFQ